MKLGGYLDGSDAIDVKDEDLIKIGESQVHKNITLIVIKSDYLITIDLIYNNFFTLCTLFVHDMQLPFSSLRFSLQRFWTDWQKILIFSLITALSECDQDRSY